MPQDSTTFPGLAAAAVGLLSLSGRLRDSLSARAVESLWPQISVSKVAVDFERQFGARTSILDPVRDGSARRGIRHAYVWAPGVRARHWSGQAIGSSTRRL